MLPSMLSRLISPSVTVQHGKSEASTSRGGSLAFDMQARVRWVGHGGKGTVIKGTASALVGRHGSWGALGGVAELSQGKGL